MRFRRALGALAGAAALMLALSSAVPAFAATPHDWGHHSRWAYSHHHMHRRDWDDWARFLRHDAASGASGHSGTAGSPKATGTSGTSSGSGSSTSNGSGSSTRGSGSSSSGSASSTTSGSGSSTTNGSGSSTGGSGSSSGSGSKGSPSAGQGAGPSSTASGGGSGSTVGPLPGVISPTARIAIDYEYTWFTPGFLLTSSCASQSSYGAWDASHGYAGIVLDLGNPLGLQSRDGLAGAEAVLKSAENCFAQGFSGVAPHDQPLIYVGFSNCIGACGAGSASTTQFTKAGQVAADYVDAGNADVQGVWLDIEGDWSTVAQVHAAVLGYLSVNPAGSGRGQWCDSTYRNYASGLPNDTWTVSAMVSQYVSPLVSAGYTCLGTQRILIPQDYNSTWLTNGSAYFSSSSALAQYVGGITVCGAVESAGTCPDLGLPGSAGKTTKWTAYAHDGYIAATSSVVAVVGGGAEKIPV